VTTSRCGAIAEPPWPDEFRGAAPRPEDEVIAGRRSSYSRCGKPCETGWSSCRIRCALRS
jgi:hypothetical protein